MGFSFLLFLQLLLAGQDGVDLLDAKSFWQKQNITVSVATMAQVLTPAPAPAPADLQQWATDLGSADAAARKAASEHLRHAGQHALPTLQPLTTASDPEVAVSARDLVAAIQATAGVGDDISRLLAIRELEKLKDAAALPTLEPLRQSQAPFEAEYAARAIAAINGQAPPAPPAAKPQPPLDTLTRCFPEGTNLVLQCNPTRLVPKPAAEGAPANGAGGMSMLMGGMQAGQNQAMVQVLRESGNFRLTSALIGVTLAANGPGQGTILLRGQFQPERVLAAIEKAATRPGAAGPEMVRGTVAGHTMLAPATPGNGPTIVLLAPDTLLLAAVNRGADYALEAVVRDALAAEATTHNAALMKLVAPLDHTAIIWGGVLIPERGPNQRLPPDMPELGDITSATLLGLPQDGGLALDLRGNGLSADARAALTTKLNDQFAKNLDQWRNGMGKMNLLPALTDFLVSLKAQSVGEQEQLTAHLNPEIMQIGPLLGLFMGGMRGGAPQPPRQMNNAAPGPGGK